MTGQLEMTFTADPLADFDTRSGLMPHEWHLCAKWCADHRRAHAWVLREGNRINDQENRAASWRQDIEPHLASNAREYGLDKGVYPGVDHNMSAPLARFYTAAYGITFRLRARAGDRVKNATPEVMPAA